MKPESALRKFQQGWIFRVLTHTGFIALWLGLLTFFLLDLSSDKYLFNLIRARTSGDPTYDFYSYYADLNSDKQQEQFRYGNQARNTSCLVVFTSSNTVKDQWNFLGKISQRTTGFFAHDMDHDSLSEVACFTLNKDTILVNIVVPFKRESHPVKDRLITVIPDSYFEAELIIQDVTFADLNRDSTDELIFSLVCGYAHQPRKVYAYDMRNDSLWSSPLTGFSFNQLTIRDLDRDGRPEIIGNTHGSNNYPEGNIPFPDTVSWAYVLDERLQFKVPPVASGPAFSNTFPVLITEDAKTKIFLVSTGDLDGIVGTAWFELTRDLSLVPADPLINRPGFTPIRASVSASGRYQVLSNVNSEEFVFSRQNEFHELIDGLGPKNLTKLYNYQAGVPEIEYCYWIELGTKELVFLNGSGKALGRLDIESSGREFRICWMGSVGREFRLLLSDNKKEHVFGVKKNPFYNFHYLILLALVAGFYAFIALLRFTHGFQFVRMENMRREILELQLRAVKTQLDPHFTFNALNTLSGLSHSGDTVGVDNFINHFSRLLRTHLQTSDRILVTLKEEIEFVVNYVELQRIRFDNTFELILDVAIANDLGWQIPKMLIQTHVENAIKHGLRGIIQGEGKKAKGERVGRVWVRVTQNEESMIIIIEDDGVGRGNSIVTSLESTGTGLEAQNRILKSVRQLYGLSISQRIDDLFDEQGQPSGTRVVLEIDG